MSDGTRRTDLRLPMLSKPLDLGPQSLENSARIDFSIPPFVAGVWVKFPCD